MGETETGWTKEFPKVDGDYFCRANEHDLVPIPFRLENGAVYEFGVGGNLRKHYDNDDGYEYLGPFAASDAEELMKLRKVATEARKWFRWYKTSHRSPVDAPISSLTVLTMLEAALNPSQSKERKNKP